MPRIDAAVVSVMSHVIHVARHVARHVAPEGVMAAPDAT